MLTGLPELLRDFQALQEIIYGVMLVVFVLLMPKGIAGLAKRIGLLPEELLVRASALRSLRRDSAAAPKSAISKSVASKPAVQGRMP